ncbi:MAG: hypothetical protein KF912_02930 [Phycisphaeraceae bacterium]|nr:hypothetical protein [Phycisphaeraceae bacterium]MBX3366255.1 hypothetical protein [Phycisphaeraceae bacterium]
MRALRVQRSAQLRKLPEHQRALVLSAVAADPRAREPWVWAELLELACFVPPPAPTRIQGFLWRVLNATHDAQQIRSTALHGIARGWSSLNDLERATALAVGAKQWGSIARDILESGDLPPTSSFVALLTDAADPGCTAALIRYATLDVPGSEDADRAALKLVQAAIARRDIGELASLLLTVSQAVRQPDAKIRRGIAWSAWALVEAEREGTPESDDARRGVLSVASASNDGPGRALSAVLRWDRDPLIRLAALRWCVIPGLERSCTDRLARATSSREHEVLLTSAHLVVRPCRRRLLHLIREHPRGRTGVLPDHATVSELSIRARRNLARFVYATGIERSHCSEAIEPLLTDQDELTRLTVVGRADPSDVRDLCFDPSPVIARTAAVCWSRAGITPARRRAPSADVRRILEALAASPHPSVRRIARRDLEQADPFRPERPVARLEARRMLAADLESFRDEVRRRLLSGDPKRQLNALRVAQWLRIVEDFESDLLSLLEDCRGSDERDTWLRAGIVSALGAATRTTSLDTIESLVEDSDPRVAANAIDALVLGPAVSTRPIQVESRLIEYKRSDAHRPRGAAVRGLAVLAARRQTDSAAAAAEIELLRHDPRPAHVAAGNWVASRAEAYRGLSEWIAEEPAR